MSAHHPGEPKPSDELSRREIMQLGGLAGLGASVPLISSCASQAGPILAPPPNIGGAAVMRRFDPSQVEARRAYMRAQRARMAQLPPPRPRYSREQLLAERAKFREQRSGKVVLDPVKAESGVSKVAYIGAEWPVIPLPANEIFQEGYVGVAGSGLGFNLDAIGEIFAFNPLGMIAIKNLIAAASTNVFIARWAFSYTPSGDGEIGVSTSVFGFGNYKLISADGPGDSHEVGASVRAVLQTSYGLSSVQTIFERTGANISEYAEFGQGVDLGTGMQVKKGVPVQMDVAVIATVWARGDDTDAEIFMTKDAGGGIICAGVSVQDQTGLLPQ